VRAWQHGPVLSGLLSGYQAAGAAEAADLDRMTGLAKSAADPWSRALPLHFTASALVVHPPTARVLLRWHPRHGRWLQVGGHGDPGESDPLGIALREAAEETGLADLAPWPDAALRQVAVCQVPASAAEPGHEHADLRFIFATGTPEAVVPESDAAELRWLAVDEAMALVGENSIRDALGRAAVLLAAHGHGSQQP
jgi:8-oxo-dGTP pyrophosphatase MutT (NUDIX family)